MPIFDFEMDEHHGARVTAGGNSIAWGCVSYAEVDHHIAELKNDLDRVAKEMKAAIRDDLAARLAKIDA
jgi:hypothetical protein